MGNKANIRPINPHTKSFRGDHSGDFVLYEGGRVLGAYSTMAAAESALDTYKANVLADVESCTYDHYEYDDYSITEFIVDAAAA